MMYSHVHGGILRSQYRNVARIPASSPFEEDDEAIGHPPETLLHNQQPHRRRRFGGAVSYRQQISEESTVTVTEGRVFDLPLLRLPPLPPLSQPGPPPSRQVIETYTDFHQAFESLSEKEKKARRRALSRLSVVGKTAERVREHPVLEVLPAAGKRFLDRAQLIPAMGLLPGVEAKPVLNLQFLEDVIRNTVRLDWASFWAKNAVQPLNVVASSLDGMESLALRSDKGDFDSFESLIQCLKSSMCV